MRWEIHSKNLTVDRSLEKVLEMFWGRERKEKLTTAHLWRPQHNLSSFKRLLINSLYSMVTPFSEYKWLFGRTENLSWNHLGDQPSSLELRARVRY